VGTGKQYRKEKQNPLGAAALFYLALEQSGIQKMGGAREIIRATLADLGVSEGDVLRYIEDHRPVLEETLARRKGVKG
jgi:hypothetical protein